MSAVKPHLIPNMELLRRSKMSASDSLRPYSGDSARLTDINSRLAKLESYLGLLHRLSLCRVFADLGDDTSDPYDDISRTLSLLEAKVKDIEIRFEETTRQLQERLIRAERPPLGSSINAVPGRLHPSPEEELNLRPAEFFSNFLLTSGTVPTAQSPAAVTEDRLTELLDVWREENLREVDAKLAKLTEDRIISEKAADCIQESAQEHEQEVASEVRETSTADLPEQSKSNGMLDSTGHDAEGHSNSRATFRHKLSQRTAKKLDVKALVIEDAHLNTLEQTVWESAIFIGLPQISKFGSVLLAFALIMNVAIQVTFTLIINRTFRTEPLNLQAIRIWRHTVGHDMFYADALTGRSLASRVCEEDPTLSIASDQTRDLADARTYIERDFDGPSLCVLVVMIWFFVALREAERILKVLLEVWLVPSSTRTCVSVELESTQQRWSLDALSHGRKIFMCFVCLLRCAVAGFLFWRGTIWLLYSISITDLVLNAVALEFIFEIDELCCIIFVPKVVKVMLDRLDIHAYAMRKTRRKEHKSEFGDLARVLIVFAFTSTVYFLFIAANGNNVREYIAMACGGNLDFVVAYHSDLDMVYYMPTREYRGFYAEDTKWKAVDDMIQGETVSYASQASDRSAMSSLLAKGASEVGDVVMPFCRDSRPSDLPAYWQKMKNAFEAPEAASCSDLASNCGSPTIPLIRMLCPETCRCFYPKPSTALSKGCPLRKCQDNKASAGYYDESLNCTDDKQPALFVNEHWRDYWRSLYATKRPNEKLAFRSVVEYAMAFGCRAISHYNLSEELCAETTNIHSLGTFCPETCTCPSHDWWGCANHCFQEDE